MKSKSASNHISLDTEIAFQRCRVWRHAWDSQGLKPLFGSDGQQISAGYVGAFIRDGKPFDDAVLIDIVRCTRCDTHRITTIDTMTGNIIGGHRYEYPDGYSDAIRGRTPSSIRMNLLVRPALESQTRKVTASDISYALNHAGNGWTNDKIASGLNRSKRSARSDWTPIEVARLLRDHQEVVA